MLPVPRLSTDRRCCWASDRQCAFGGYDGQLGSASAGIEVAHVRWFYFDGPDALDNGLALCVPRQTPAVPPDAGLTRWDVSTDLFAVGVVLYQLLCDGEHPYLSSRPMLDEPVIDPRVFRPDLNPALAEFLIEACAPANVDCFSTAAEMQLALQKVRADL
jgi:hypothetical protein